MTSRHALVIHFALLTLFGLACGVSALDDADPPRWVNLAYMVASTVNLYRWYTLDAQERGYVRTSAMGGAMVLAAFGAIPVYLVKSRPVGQRRRALLRFLGALVLTLMLPGLIALPFELLSTQGSGQFVSEVPPSQHGLIP